MFTDDNLIIDAQINLKPALACSVEALCMLACDPGARLHKSELLKRGSVFSSFICSLILFEHTN